MLSFNRKVELTHRISVRDHARQQTGIALHFSATTIASAAGSRNSGFRRKRQSAASLQYSKRNINSCASLRPGMPLHRDGPVMACPFEGAVKRFKAPPSWLQLDETTMNSPLPRRFYYLLLVFGVLAGTLFVAATVFFPERSVERISAYFILTMGTCMLMCAIGLTLTHHWIDQHFAAQESGHGPHAQMEPSLAPDPQPIVLKPARQTNNCASDKTHSECVVSTTN